jgi:hypothetical protein
MSHDFPESDWKILRELTPILLDRVCKRVLDELTRLAAPADESHHARYLKIYTLIHKRNDEIANAFDDLRRSTAVLRLLAIRSLGLLADEELARFSPDTRARLEGWSAEDHE